jgi:hypothetical protein
MTRPIAPRNSWIQQKQMAIADGNKYGGKPVELAVVKRSNHGHFPNLCREQQRARNPHASGGDRRC